MKKILLFLTLLSLSFGANAYENDYDGLLKSHVRTVTKDGVTFNAVNYKAWAKDKRHAKARDSLLKVDLNTLRSKDGKLAFWINAYNLLTVDLITREEETESIKNLGNLFKSPWKKFSWKIDGESYTLDDIEHTVIRKLNEPRIHFAINCAAISCPDLRNEAYRSDKLNAQLEDQVESTLNNISKGFKVVDDDKVQVTKVMDWFNKDFKNGNINLWLQEYKEIINDDTKISFYDYDWALNKQ